MKKFLLYSIFLIFILLFSLTVILSTTGISTNKFNKLISEKVTQTNNINLELKDIKFKINPKELSLFLETRNPKITYKDLLIPIKNLRLYVDFSSLIKSKPKTKKINLTLEELDVSEINKLSYLFKPSNFRSFLNNKITEGKIISEIDFFFDKEGSINNFITKGKVNDLKAELFSGLNLKNTNLSFFADKNDVLIKNIFGDLEDIKIYEGDIKLNFENGIKLNSNFNSKIDFDEKKSKQYEQIFKKINFENKIEILKADIINSLTIDFDETYKVKKYNYSISGEIKKSNLNLSKPFENNLIKNEIKKIYFSNIKFKSILNKKNINLQASGKYSLNNKDFLLMNFENFVDNDFYNLKIDFDYIDTLKFDLINYEKPANSMANLYLDLKKNKNKIFVNEVKFSEAKNLIKIEGLNFDKNKFLSFEKVEVKTPNNDFSIKNKKKIKIIGSKIDATNLFKFFKKQSNENLFQNLNNDIEIDFKDIIVPMSEKIKNFKLIGEIKKGQFSKISSKGEFGGNNFLDISMQKDKNSKKKYLEIYSDLTRPLLTEYNFFNGLSGGKLLFTSIIDETNSYSKLKIEDFKVINAPGVIKLLSLADLGGLADLAQGDGLSFDVLEIDMKKDKNFLELRQILALGPSMSVIMEGYQDENGITSLKGTLVPAKTLNKIISNIPVIGNIVIPKEAGEGLFGISFKMKGPEGKIRTSINPLKTLTPRFIQKILDRKKEIK